MTKFFKDYTITELDKLLEQHREILSEVMVKLARNETLTDAEKNHTALTMHTIVIIDEAIRYKNSKAQRNPK